MVKKIDEGDWWVEEIGLEGYLYVRFLYKVIILLFQYLSLNLTIFLVLKAIKFYHSDQNNIQSIEDSFDFYIRNTLMIVMSFLVIIMVLEVRKESIVFN